MTLIFDVAVNSSKNIAAVSCPEAPNVSILFQGHANQLAAGANSGFCEELLKRRFHGGFGNIQLRGDFLVAQTSEHAFEHLALTIGQFI